MDRLDQHHLVGFLGQSNVGHIIRDEAIACAFLAYWEQLAADTVIEPMKAWCSRTAPTVPQGSRTPA